MRVLVYTGVFESRELAHSRETYIKSKKSRTYIIVLIRSRVSIPHCGRVLGKSLVPKIGARLAHKTSRGIPE